MQLARLALVLCKKGLWSASTVARFFLAKHIPQLGATFTLPGPWERSRTLYLGGRLGKVKEVETNSKPETNYKSLCTMITLDSLTNVQP